MAVVAEAASVLYGRAMIGNDHDGIIGPRGQIEIKRGGMGDELRLPLAQGLWLALIGMIALVMVMADMVLIGPVSGVLIGVVIILALWWLGFRWIEHYATLLAIGLVIAWLMLGGRAVIAIWPEALLTLHLPPWATILGLLLSVPVLAGCGLVIYRLAYEIVDPWWPPPLAQRTPDFGIAWPGRKVQESEEEAEDTGSDELAEIRAALEEVLAASRQPVRERLVLINGDAKEALPAGRKVIEIMLEQVNDVWCAYRDGYTPVPVDDIRRMAALSERVGLSYRKTRPLFRWGEDGWRSTLTTLEALGILVQAGGQREATLLVSPDEAVQMIDAKLVIPDDPTAPPDEAAETVAPNVADDRQTVSRSKMSGVGGSVRAPFMRQPIKIDK